MPRVARGTPKRKARKASLTKQEPAILNEDIFLSEWTLPAGYTVDGARMATLQEVVDPTFPTRSLAQLSEDHRFDLAAKRIEMKPEGFRLKVLGYGVIGRARALAEVRARSKIGRHLAEIEEIAIIRGIKRGRDPR